MRRAILAYDLKNVQMNDNNRVKEALLAQDGITASGWRLNTNAPFTGFNSFLATLPNTTLWITVDDDPSLTAKVIAEDIAKCINSLGIEYKSVYVAFTMPDDFIINT